MKKLFKFFLLFFVIFTTITIRITVKAAEAPKLVIVNPGEDASTQMNISFHASDVNNLVLYYEAEEGANDKFTSVGQQLSVLAECSPTPFSGRTEQHCSASLENLKPNTYYLFNIGPTAMPADKVFKTAGAAEFTFAAITDVHSYFSGGVNNRVATANKVLNKLDSIKNLDFVLASGDMTAYGTVFEQWEALYNMDAFKTNMFANTPGNHDYYNPSAASVGVDYFNAVTNNPKNGATGDLNSTYYFKYGNTLFISLNSEDASNNQTLRANQIKWLNEVTANNPADFVIAFTHRPFYTGDNLNAGQASDMRSFFQEIFDNTGVDLVLSGHNHVYARTTQVYKNAKVTGSEDLIPYLGTIYVTGIQIGDRYVTAPGTKPELVEVAHLGAGQDGGNLITVSKDKISIEFIKADGTRLYPYEIACKSDAINQTRIEENINANKENDTIKINYGQEIPGLIKKIVVYDDKNEVLATKLNPTNEIISIANAPKVGKYKLKVELSLRDGEVITKNFEIVDPKYDFGKISDLKVEEEEFRSVLKWTSEIEQPKVDHFEIYVNGKLLKTVAKDQESTELDKISPYNLNQISFRIIGPTNNILETYDLTFGEKAEQLYVVFNYDTVIIKETEATQLEYTIFPEREVVLEFVSSNPAIATVDKNGKVTAVGVGTCTISLNVVKRWDVNSEVTIIVEELPEVVQPKPEPDKKGCLKSAYIFTGISILGLTFILRKKKW